MIPYKDLDSDTNLNKYLLDYEGKGENNIPEKTKKYLEQNGALALNKKADEILKNALPATIEHSGGPVLYVDAILRGNSKENLDVEVFTYTESEYNVETFLKSMFNDYQLAVANGDPSIMYPYVTSDGQSHTQYEKNIPKYYEKSMNIKLINYKINGMKVDSNGDCLITCTTEFEITSPSGTKIQKEKADYIIKRIANTEFLLDRIENWAIVK